MSIGWVSSVNGRICDLVDDDDLSLDEVARDARLLRRLVLFSLTMLVVSSAVLALAVRMLLG